MVSPSAMNIKTALRDFPPGTVILSRRRRILVREALGINGIKEALIKSLFAFILEFLCNARNGLTRIASYLRKPMTKQCIKILIKENSMN